MEKLTAELTQLFSEADRLMEQITQTHDEMEQSATRAFDKAAQDLTGSNTVEDPHLLIDAALDSQISSILEQTEVVAPEVVEQHESELTLSAVSQTSSRQQTPSRLPPVPKKDQYAHVKSSYAQKPVRQVSKPISQPSEAPKPPPAVSKPLSAPKIEPSPQKPVGDSVEFDDNFVEEAGTVEVKLQQSAESQLTESVEDKALMTEIRPENFKCSELVESILEDDEYVQKVAHSFGLPPELKDADEQLTEQLSVYGDKLLSVLTEAAAPEVQFADPQLSSGSKQLWEHLKLQPFNAKIEIPFIQGQPDFLREQQRDKMIQRRLDGIDFMLKKIADKTYQQPTEKELKELILDTMDEQARDMTQKQEGGEQARVEVLLKEIDEDVEKYMTDLAAPSAEGVDIASLQAEQERLEKERQDAEEKKFKAQQESEQREKDAAEVRKAQQAQMQALEKVSGMLRQQEPTKRVGSARTILQASDKPADVKPALAVLGRCIEK